MHLGLEQGVVRRHGGAPRLLAARPAREVGLVEEPREQHEVAEVHRDGQLDVERRDVTVGPALEEMVRPEVDRAPHDHLQQLQRGDQHGELPRGAVPHRPQRVVRVHDRVHAVVHHDEPPRAGRVLREAEPAVEQHGDVVVPVEEDQRLLPEHDEDGVPQLGQLAQHEHERPEARDAVLRDERGHAHAVVEAVVGERVQELRPGPAGPHDAEDRQGGVPEGEHPAQLEPRPVLHQVLPPEDEHHVRAHVVEALGPVLGHPHAALLVDEAGLEVEDVRVVGERDLRVLLHGEAGAGLRREWTRGRTRRGYKSDERTPARPRSPPLRAHAPCARKRCADITGDVCFKRPAGAETKH